jgi:hypothetical protein
MQDMQETATDHESINQEARGHGTRAKAEESSSKFTGQIPGAEYLRRQFPQSMHVLERVAQSWNENGNFEELGIRPPLAQMIVQKGLIRAEGVERKLEETGVLPIVRAQVQTLKQKWESRKR